jgi:hypothetical protein
LVGLLGRGISPTKGHYLTQDRTTQKNAHIHPWLQWDSNSRSQSNTARALDCAAIETCWHKWYVNRILLFIVKFCMD